MVIEPVQKDETFLADVDHALQQQAALDSDPFSLWWLGQSGFLVLYREHFLLLDPYLSDSLTEKYADSDKPHIRMTARVIDPARLGFIHFVTSSHNHTDHLDAATILPIAASNPQLNVLVPAANLAFATERLTPRTETLGKYAQPAHTPHLTTIDVDQTVSLGPFEITAIPAAHEQLERDEEGRHRFVGYLVRCGSRTLYHSGDTLRYEGQAQRLAPWHVDLAMLPINGREPQRRVAGNLSAQQAAQLGRDARMRLVIPCHYDMFRFNTADPKEFAEACEQLGQSFAILQAGERLNSWQIDFD